MHHILLYEVYTLMRVGQGIKDKNSAASGPFGEVVDLASRLDSLARIGTTRDIEGGRRTGCGHDRDKQDAATPPQYRQYVRQYRLRPVRRGRRLGEPARFAGAHRHHRSGDRRRDGPLLAGGDEVAQGGDGLGPGQGRVRLGGRPARRFDDLLGPTRWSQPSS
jgi:hypothetical protein